MRILKILICVISTLLLVACGGKQSKEKIVSVTIEPQRYFAEMIAGDKYKVHCVVPFGQSPETYDPTPQQIVQIGKSQAYFRIGSIGFELVWMKNIEENNPELKIFNLSDGIHFIKIDEDDHHHHSHGEGDHNCHHHHGGIDPHTWSGISGAKIIAKNTLDAFIALDPENKDFYINNYEKLKLKIEATEREVSRLMQLTNDKTFIIYHPALTYFANEYNLTQLCIEMDGKEPSPAQLKLLVETAKEHKARVVFIQQEFDKKNAELIAKETGCRLVSINPLSYDWSKEMIHIAKSLADE